MPLGAIATLGAGALASAGQVYANNQNIKFQEKANREQVNLANTAHQREMRDLLAAGLNPVLSASGSGASVPSLGVADQGNIGQGLSDGLTSASKFVSDEYHAQVNNLRASTHNVNADTDAKRIQSSLVTQQKENEEIRGDMLRADRKANELNRTNDVLRNFAILEAITGKHPKGLEEWIDYDDDDAMRTYINQIDQYRNEVELKRYLNSVERQKILDITNTAKTLKEIFGKNPPRIVNHFMKGAD